MSYKLLKYLFFGGGSCNLALGSPLQLWWIRGRELAFSKLKCLFCDLDGCWKALTAQNVDPAIIP